jgi:uncharacterized protein involved in type VI secretion and phage assembly
LLSIAAASAALLAPFKRAGAKGNLLNREAALPDVARRLRQTIADVQSMNPISPYGVCGQVTKVDSKNRVRVMFTYGVDERGRPIESNWLDTAMPMGGRFERDVSRYEVGQIVMCVPVDGGLRNGVVIGRPTYR